MQNAVRVLDGESMRDTIYGMIDEVIEKYVGRTIGDDQIPEEWDLAELNMNLLPIIPFEPITFDPERDKEFE